MDAPWWCPSEGLQWGGRKHVKTSGIYFGYLKDLLLSFELATIHIDASLAMLAFQTSKKHTESMFSCTWQACEQTSLCHVLWKNLKFKLLYFQNKARYRAENMQADKVVSIRWCLHDTGATFIPARVHPSSLLWLCIRLHDTSTKCHAGASHNGASSPRSLCRSEIFISARKFIPVSCKRGMTVRFIFIKVSSIYSHPNKHGFM